MTIVNCPTCNKEVMWSPESKFRPFCSKRCRLIDLGEWADEKKFIAGTDEEFHLSEDESTLLKF